jgi:hypothetical protein
LVTQHLLDAEEAMFQEMQEGWITYEEFEAFENYVLNHTIGDDNYSSSTMLPSCHGLRAWAVVSKVNWSIGLPFFDSRAMVSSSHSSEMEIDAVSDTQTVIGALLTMLNPIVGLAILADSLIGNHATPPMIGYIGGVA